MSEITIGPITFEYDGSKGMTVAIGEEVVGYCEFVFPEQWQAFVEETQEDKEYADRYRDLMR